MALPSDQGSTENLKGTAAQTLIERKDEILITWEKLVRERVATARTLSQPALIDTLPIFLANLAQALSPSHTRTLATESNNVAQEHGGERARVTRYGPEQIIQEYQILRDVVEEKLSEKSPVNALEKSTIQNSFDKAIQEAMMAYFIVHGRVRDQFVATLSHDLRNPLGAAKMSAELILRILNTTGKELDSDHLKKLAARAIDNVKRADRMVQNLLDTNHNHIGERLILNLQPNDMHAIARSVLNELSDADRSRAELIGESLKGYWDRDMLWRAIENLVANAFKYGDETKPVTVRIYEKLGRAMISIHNEGNPIPAEEQDLLFQAFRRSTAAKASGKRGWGIGLSQARGVAESHGGSLGVDSSFETGTTFTLDLPSDARPFQDAPVS